MRNVTRSVIVTGMVLGCICGAQAGVVIDWVPVGDPGNAADDLGDGAVAYSYYIDKYEVTTSQYADFLNTVAADDPYELYNPDMEGGMAACGIIRTGSPGSYEYGVIPGRENKPVNYVSFWDSCRFANWMHNGQGSGDTETGAYTLTPEAVANNTVTRNPGAQVFVTSNDEWCKAAYYKGGGLDAGYWYYATQASDWDWPDPEAPPGASSVGSANWYYAVYDLTDVGAYTFKPSVSAYGTFDQTGNVEEWNEAIAETTFRCLRGGAWDSPWLKGIQYAIGRKCSWYLSPTYEENTLGFRIGAIPEPATIALLVLAGLVVMRRRR
ncbi:MAG: SUMF1/EgtB/PvdO family nonheme iron enzyme [Phycisphaerae bacterium]|nr:SUMF1/EgtB/PvdO family nonheme iron enzyme [Phycisphaerae bacterium]